MLLSGHKYLAVSWERVLAKGLRRQMPGWQGRFPPQSHTLSSLPQARPGQAHFTDEETEAHRKGRSHSKDPNLSHLAGTPEADTGFYTAGYKERWQTNRGDGTASP
jgi:hypothetical protein